MTDSAPQLDLIATMPFGLESVVGRELAALGYTEQTTSDGRVQFQGDWSAVCRSNVWLRSADRVLWKIAEFHADDFDTLFEITTLQDWPNILGKTAAFPVRAKSVRSQLHHTPTIQSMVKKSIVESLQRRFGGNWFDETGPAYEIDVSILKDKVTLAINTTGPSLHKRGYRTLVGSAPLKETLAAALVQLSFWNRERPLIDPFCGSGTIAIEAAMIGLNRAPGMHREFACETWPQIASEIWTDVREDAKSQEVEKLAHPILATDIDTRAIQLARTHAAAAGIEDAIHFERKPFAELQTSREYGCIITNPPYGERSSSQRQAEATYRQMPKVFESLPTWSFYVLASNPKFEQLINRKADRRRKLYNGRLACTYYQFHGPRPPRAVPAPAKEPT
ncbi:THUMP domain-containing class I SAM-dependent RNA methyltransferase [Thalassoroseus pseudoceratinae]|uniref:THUMP domain-containing class I SAM-dependent RNA methyltransferase n=1 Tax=Thalassoroseus pseudoceratinae TaxID=2713176 RepID=UPI00141E3DF2|nr:class I SAM-dependent RNA methyltransferase [Thalassoroseus pseudoceratinae]